LEHFHPFTFWKSLAEIKKIAIKKKRRRRREEGKPCTSIEGARSYAPLFLFPGSRLEFH
jgi:hypothetical protein